MQTHMQIHTHKHVHIYTQVCLHFFAGEPLHIRTQTHMHIHTYTRAHMHTQVCLHFFAGEPLLMSAGADNALKHWVFDNMADAAPRLLRFRSGHAAPPSVVAHYGEVGAGLCVCVCV